MFRNKITAMFLVSSMLMGSVLPVYGDPGEEAVSVSAQSVTSETENEEVSGEESPTEEVSSETEGENPGQETENQSESQENPSSDQEGFAEDSESGRESGENPPAETAETGQSEVEAAAGASVEDTASQAADESQAPQQTTGVPGTPAPDLSWVSPAGIRGASYTVTESAGNKQAGVSSAVRKDYKKVDAAFAVARLEKTEIRESQDPASRVTGTIAKGGILYVLKEKADFLYVESGDVRGYVSSRDVITGAAAMEHAEHAQTEETPSVEVLVPLEENAAADDFSITAYQFTKASGEDVIRYAKRHRRTVFREKGDDWETGVDNEAFIRKVYSFYNLYQEEAAKEGYKSSLQAVPDLSGLQAGDLLKLDTGEFCLYTGKDSVLLCSEKEQGVCEKSVSDVLVVSSYRPDYDSQLPEEKPADDVLVGSTVEEQCWNYLTKNLGLSEIAAAGALGNIYAECGLKPGNLENWVNSLMNCTDEQFTAACDTGVYTLGQFLDDKYTFPTSGNGSQWGYGLIGFTSRSAKAVLWANTVAMGRSLSDLRGQLDAVAQIYGEKLFWISSSSTDQAAADWFYYVGMGNPLGGTQGYGYEYTIPSRQAYAADFYARFHS